MWIGRGFFHLIFIHCSLFVHLPLRLAPFFYLSFVCLYVALFRPLEQVRERFCSSFLYLPVRLAPSFVRLLFVICSSFVRHLFVICSSFVRSFFVFSLSARATRTVFCSSFVRHLFVFCSLFHYLLLWLAPSFNYLPIVLWLPVVLRLLIRLALWY